MPRFPRLPFPIHGAVCALAAAAPLAAAGTTVAELRNLTDDSMSIHFEPDRWQAEDFEGLAIRDAETGAALPALLVNAPGGGPRLTFRVPKGARVVFNYAFGDAGGQFQTAFSLSAPRYETEMPFTYSATRTGAGAVAIAYTAGGTPIKYWSASEMEAPEETKEAGSPSKPAPES